MCYWRFICIRSALRLCRAGNLCLNDLSPSHRLQPAAAGRVEGVAAVAVVV
jgi:hypothetical protein